MLSLLPVTINLSMLDFTTKSSFNSWEHLSKSKKSTTQNNFQKKCSQIVFLPLSKHINPQDLN